MFGRVNFGADLSFIARHLYIIALTSRTASTRESSEAISLLRRQPQFGARGERTDKRGLSLRRPPASWRPAWRAGLPDLPLVKRTVCTTRRGVEGSIGVNPP